MAVMFPVLEVEGAFERDAGATSDVAPLAALLVTAGALAAVALVVDAFLVVALATGAAFAGAFAELLFEGAALDAGAVAGFVSALPAGVVCGVFADAAFAAPFFDEAADLAALVLTAADLAAAVVVFPALALDDVAAATAGFAAPALPDFTAGAVLDPPLVAGALRDPPPVDFAAPAAVVTAFFGAASGLVGTFLVAMERPPVSAGSGKCTQTTPQRQNALHQIRSG
ncbi:MAG: hypothetical protein AB7V43_01685 [Acidimicrobiia bacterium]